MGKFSTNFRIIFILMMKINEFVAGIKIIKNVMGKFVDLNGMNFVTMVFGNTYF